MRNARGSRFLPLVALASLVAMLLLLITGTAVGQIPGLPGYGSTTTAGPTTTVAPTTTTQGGNQNAQGNQQNGQQNAQQNGQQNAQQNAQGGGNPNPPNTTVNLPNQQVGSSFSVTFGGFTPGEVINLIFNGVLEQGTKTADANGQVTLTVTIFAVDRIDTDDVMTNGRCGPNDLVARGQRSGVRATENFNIDCQAAGNNNNGGGGNNNNGGGGNNNGGANGNNNGGLNGNNNGGANNGGLNNGGANNGGANNGAGGLAAGGGGLAAGGAGLNGGGGLGAGGAGGLSPGAGVLGSNGGIPNGAYFGPNGELLAPDGTVILPSGAVPLGLSSRTGPAAGSVLATPAGGGTNANLGNGTAAGGARGSNGRSSTAFTGSNVVRLTLIGMVCIALGWQLTRLRRRGILS